MSAFHAFLDGHLITLTHANLHVETLLKMMLKIAMMEIQ